MCSCLCVVDSKMSTDREPSGDVMEVSDKATSFRVWKPRRTVVVEPIVLITGFCGIPMGMMSQFYIIDYFTAQMSNGTTVNSTSDHFSNQSDSLCDVNKSDPAYLFGERVQARASNFNMVLSLCSLIPALFVTSFIGAYSDQAGRRYSLIPPLVGGTVRAISYVIVIAFKLPVEYLLIGALIEGCGGYYQTMLMGCFSYISDTVPLDRRAMRITIVETCVFIPAIFAPIGIGYWLRYHGFLAPFIIVLGLYMTALLYAIFFIPETVPYNSKAKFFSTKHLKKTVLLFTADDGTRRRWKLCVILLAFFLCSTVKVGDSIDTLFEMNSPLCWTSDIVSYFMSAEVAFISASAVITMYLLKCCLRDIGIALTSGTMAIVHLTYMAFIQNSIMMYISKYNRFQLLPIISDLLYICYVNVTSSARASSESIFLLYQWTLTITVTHRTRQK